MTRMPVSAPGSFFSKAVGNPSVRRVEAKRVPAARRLLKLMVVGKIEPVQRRPPPASVERRPRTGTPTLRGLVLGLILPIIELGTPLTESVASTGVAEPIPNWLTLPRRFVRRRATPPDAGTVIEIPLKATELAVCK